MSLPNYSFGLLFDVFSVTMENVQVSLYEYDDGSIIAFDDDTIRVNIKDFQIQVTCKVSVKI